MSVKLTSFPAEDGFRMPGEFEPHHGCIMIWPERPGSWNYGAVNARKAFCEIAKAISESEKVYMLVSDSSVDSARAMLPSNITLQFIASNDAWARDTAPTFVCGADGSVRAVDWQFNAWGGKYDGLYSHWEKDDALAKEFCIKNGYDFYDAHPFVLEGGAIHSDGQGTLITTESCLLSRGRNPKLSKCLIEDTLKKYLNVKKIIWLPEGIYNDETNGHVDNICAFVRPGEVLLAWSDNENDPQYEISRHSFDVLQNSTDAAGRNIVIHKLPVPDFPVCISQYELDGFEFEEGEDAREAGERLAASYVNFYFSNVAVILPQFGNENAESDRCALEILEKVCPERKIIPIYARDIIVGGGNIHCITQQIPRGEV